MLGFVIREVMFLGYLWLLILDFIVYDGFGVFFDVDVNVECLWRLCVLFVVEGCIYCLL